MAEEDAVTIVRQEPIQLAQVRVPLDSAADAFATRDAWGRVPITIVPARSTHIRTTLIVAALSIIVAAAVAQSILAIWWIVPLAIPFVVALTISALWSAFFVSIPEGSSALLSWSGKYLHTIQSGLHLIPPWIVVSHLVTQREIPFDIPVVEAQTQDNMRATIATLFTFTISDPYRFVYAISADDFDQILHASCQEALRALIRQVPAQDVVDLMRTEQDSLAQTISLDVAPYGIQIEKMKVMYARPHEEFLRLQEMRRLMAARRAEQTDTQADADTFARQELLARIERDRDALQLQLQQAEALKQVSLLEADAAELRLAKLEERLRAFPRAALYEQELERLKVTQSLAGDAPARLHGSSADNIAGAFKIHDMSRHPAPDTASTREATD